MQIYVIILMYRARLAITWQRLLSFSSPEQIGDSSYSRAGEEE